MISSLSSSHGSSSAHSATKTKVSDAETISQFKAFMSKSPEQIMRDEILKSLGYTEESLNSLSPKERAKIEAKIAELIKEKQWQSMKEKGVPVPSGASIVSLLAQNR